MTTTSPPAETMATTAELLDVYADAWAAHDLDGILAMHTDDTVFQLHDGSAPAVGLDQVREAFALVLAVYPDLAAVEVRRSLGAGHAVFESQIRATVDGVLRSLDAVDVFDIVEGRIARKDTYLDTAALHGLR